MQLNNEETLTFIKFRNKIDEIWQDQVFAGTFGKATLDEVIANFNSLLEKINSDSTLTPEHKKELSEIIENKKNLAPNREKEISQAEKAYTADPHTHSNSFRNARSRYKNLPADQRLRHSELCKKLSMGYDIFFTPEQLDNLFTNNDISFEEISSKYPIISKDLKGIFDRKKEIDSRDEF